VCPSCLPCPFPKYLLRSNFFSRRRSFLRPPLPLVTFPGCVPPGLAVKAEEYVSPRLFRPLLRIVSRSIFHTFFFLFFLMRSQSFTMSKLVSLSTGWDCSKCPSILSLLPNLSRKFLFRTPSSFHPRQRAISWSFVKKPKGVKSRVLLSYFSRQFDHFQLPSIPVIHTVLSFLPPWFWPQHLPPLQELSGALDLLVPSGLL